jgi:glycosyltransferase involved in cell wall biosynthesis
MHHRQVASVHDLILFEHPEWFSPSYRRLHRTLLRHQLQAALAFITLSEPVRDRLAEIVPRDREILVVPCAPSDSIRPIPLSAELAQRIGVTDKCGYFLSVGSLEPRKNIKALLQAYTQLPADLADAYPLVIVGGAAGSFTERGQEHSSPNLNFSGYLSDEDLGALYGSATAFVSVSLAEGFGIPVVEAMACGCPLVISDIPVYRWISAERASS